MIQFINHFSFLLFIIPVVGLILVWLLRGKGSRVKQIVAVALVLGLAGLYLWLRPGSLAADKQTTESLLAAGNTPVLINFYSDY